MLKWHSLHGPNSNNLTHCLSSQSERGRWVQSMGVVSLITVLQNIDKVKVEFSHDELFDFYQKVSFKLNLFFYKGKSVFKSWLFFSAAGVYSRAVGRFKLILVILACYSYLLLSYRCCLSCFCAKENCFVNLKTTLFHKNQTKVVQI